MTLNRIAYRTLNACLGQVGFELRRKEPDLAARLIDADDLSLVFDAFASQLQPWFDKQGALDIPRARDIRPDVEEFYSRYISSPFRQTDGGSRFNNQLLLFLIARLSKAAMIIDSGTFTGASAWAFAMGSPESQIVSFDLDLRNLKYRTPGVEYVEMDWAKYDFGTLDPSTIVYFDDHVNQIQRLFEAADRNVRTLIFDDDFWIGSFASMANGGFSLPKISFACEPALAGRAQLRWIDRDKTHVFQLPQNDLALARAQIEIYDRMPNTSLITGIHQTPFTMVRTRQI